MIPVPSLQLLERDVVSDVLGRGVWWDSHVFDALADHCDGDVLDIGANVGALTLRFALYAPRVIAFEPNPEMTACLLENIRRMGLTNVEVIEQGVYSRPVFIGPDITGYPASSWTWKEGLGGVPAGPAQWSQMDRRVSAIKVDIQGADLHALIGLEETIDRDRPWMVVEFENDLARVHGHSLEDYLDWARRHHYTMERFAMGHGDLLCTPKEI